MVGTGGVGLGSGECSPDDCPPINQLCGGDRVINCNEVPEGGCVGLVTRRTCCVGVWTRYDCSDGSAGASDECPADCRAFLESQPCLNDGVPWACGGVFDARPFLEGGCRDLGEPGGAFCCPRGFRTDCQ